MTHRFQLETLSRGLAGELENQERNNTKRIFTLVRDSQGKVKPKVGRTAKTIAGPIGLNPTFALTYSSSLLKIRYMMVVTVWKILTLFHISRS